MTTDLESKLVEIYFHADNFCKELSTMKVENNWMLGSKKQRNRNGKLTMGEIITILIFYQLYGAEDFKHFYLNSMLPHYRKDFPDDDRKVTLSFLRLLTNNKTISCFYLCIFPAWWNYVSLWNEICFRYFLSAGFYFLPTTENRFTDLVAQEYAIGHIAGKYVQPNQRSIY